MSTADNQQDRIDDYLLGAGSPEDRSAFERELAADPELQARLDATELAMAAIEMHEDAALKQRLQHLEGTFAKSSPLKAEVNARPEARVVKMDARRKPQWTWLAYAASLLLLLAAGWFILQPSASSPSRLAMAHFEPEDNIAFTFERGAADEDGEAAAFRAYEDGNYIEAERGLAVLPATPARTFYRGQALLALQQFAEAEPLFRDTAVADFGLQEESEYYLAVALVGQGKTAEAREVLEEIVANTDHAMTDDARKFLDDLD